MSTTQQAADRDTTDTRASRLAYGFESTTLPVADVDRAKAFYEGLGWRLDADFDLGEEGRIVQLTPPQSAASIQFGKPTTMQPGSIEGLLLVVEDIAAAREELLERGVDVSEVWHNTEPAKGKAPGVDPERRSYFSWATFADPDGNRWLLQEITERIPGRVW